VPEPRILIAENDQTLRHGLYRAMLDVELFSDCASDAAAAIELMLGQRYAVVVLDAALVGGADAVIAASQRLPAGERPILFATAEPESIGRLDADAVQVVMRRPLRTREVAELARACIDTRAARRRRAEREDELRP
jgi:DNA-binding response OmpR family regulator